MMSVWFVWHVDEHGFNAGDVKFIGVYESPEEAEGAITQLCQKPGFQDALDGFHISRYEINQDYWSNGFKTGDSTTNRNVRAEQSVLTIVKQMEKRA